MKLKTFFENFELLTDTPNAAAKLQELILKLAVRGKLILQVTNEQVTVTQLEVVKRNKKSFDDKKQVRESKGSSEINYSDIAYQIPKNWIWTRLSNIITLKSGSTIDLGLEIDKGELIYLKVGDMNLPGNEIEITNSSRYVLPTKKIEKQTIPGNSIIFPKRGGAIGTNKKRLVKQAILADSNIMAMICHEGLDIEYLYTWFYTVDLWQLNSGTSVPQINNKDLEPLLFPFPPLAEQKRIVEKCDRLLSICDEIEKRQQQRQESILRMNESAIAQLLSSQNPEEFRQHWQRICNNFDLLYSIPETIPKLRQAILELAVQGKLVRQLPNEEPASKVLQKIKEEKEELAKQGIVVKEKTLASISLDELSFNIPESWIWVRLGQIVKSIRYGTSRHCSYEQNGVPILRIPNLINGKIDQQDLKFTVLSEKELLELKLERNDLLMIRSNGSKSLIGRTAIVSADVEGYGYAGYLVRLKIFLNYIDSRYLNLALDTNFVRYQIEIPIRTTSGVKNINSTEISNLILPLPPLGEQKRIVEKCDRLMSLCDTLEAKLKQGRDSSEKLMEVAAKQVLTA
ncbi:MULTISPECIES: restriction endonuclease subunit S [Nostoc]|uniref:Restriction endonuclease subunit S n=2 Tax=Nostoc TaxID=1177 RepID=A0ABR8IBI2_9NOSO|nr:MULTISPECIES: restriction endonuclease subunit S [Nostoc]MBD2563134.1 restriction endonuclease subunit S [Nostoc linckia FACHB-391]MBD2648463.1 restriction endonuclease subunit S [Nostoc foliaceum FACHB-393]